ncbi:MAG: hypothetical protein ACOYEP_04610 [Limnochordia bacterium]
MSQLTQREFLFLDDALQAAQLESKCFADLAQRCQEPVLRELCTNLAQMHQRHCERMAQYMKSGQGQQPQNQQLHQWMQSQPAYMGQG